MMQRRSNAMANDQARGIEVFCAYAEKDQNLFEELEKHLTPLRRQGRITTWNRQKISAGKKKQEEIDAHLDTAQIILLLISADYMDSDYYSTIEVARAIQKHNAGAARVIPILLRECDLKDTPLESLQTLPRKGTIYG